MNSTNPDQWQAVEQQVSRGDVDILLISPERLNAPDFVRGPLAQLNPSLVVIDEAHCISDWGHDFRPDYRSVGRLVRTLPNVSLLATTATASGSPRRCRLSPAVQAAPQTGRPAVALRLRQPRTAFRPRPGRGGIAQHS